MFIVCGIDDQFSDPFPCENLPLGRRKFGFKLSFSMQKKAELITSVLLSLNPVFYFLYVLIAFYSHHGKCDTVFRELFFQKLLYRLFRKAF